MNGRGETPTYLRMGSYRLGRLLADGPFGKVFEAGRSSDARPEVALNAVPVLGDSSLIEGLRDDAVAQAKAGHPGLCPVIEVFESGGFAAIVTPLAAGGSLASRLAEDREPSLDEVVGWLGTIADAVAALHRCGLAHGGISASSVLFECPNPLDRPELCWLADAGLAERLAGPEWGARIRAGEWADPGRKAGQCAAPQSDVYALASIAHQAVAGSWITRASGRREGAMPRWPRSRSTDPSYDEVLTLVERALSVRPEERPDAATLASVARSCRGASPRSGVDGAPREPEQAPRPLIRLGSAPGGASSPRGEPHVSDWSVEAMAGRRNRLGTARRRVIVPLLAIVVVSALVSFVAWRHNERMSSHARCARLTPTPAPGVSMSTGGWACAQVVGWRAGVVTLRRGGAGRLERVLLGRPGDQLLIGDWYCSGRDEPAIYRPRTGDVVFYRAWTGGPSAGFVASSHVVDGRPRVVRVSGRPCDVVRITAGHEG